MNWSIRGAIILLLSLPTLASASNRIDLNHDWQFCIDAHDSGEASAWQKRPPVDTESVNVPHTWNVGKHDSYLGRAWYFRNFEAPVQSVGGHVELHFGATFYSSRVWLNGVEVGHHEGGYTAYSFDITLSAICELSGGRDRQSNYRANHPWLCHAPAVSSRCLVRLVGLRRHGA